LRAWVVSYDILSILFESYNDIILHMGLDPLVNFVRDTVQDFGVCAQDVKKMKVFMELFWELVGMGNADGETATPCLRRARSDGKVVRFTRTEGITGMGVTLVVGYVLRVLKNKISFENYCGFAPQMVVFT